MIYLEAGQVRGFEVVGGATTPVHDVLILALAAQFPVPVGYTQVVVHHALAVGTVLQHGVEKRLQRGRDRERERELMASDKMKTDGVQGSRTRRSAFLNVYISGEKKDSAFLGLGSNT